MKTNLLLPVVHIIHGNMSCNRLVSYGQGVEMTGLCLQTRSMVSVSVLSIGVPVGLWCPVPKVCLAGPIIPVGSVLKMTTMHKDGQIIGREYPHLPPGGFSRNIIQVFAHCVLIQQGEEVRWVNVLNIILLPLFTSVHLNSLTCKEKKCYLQRLTCYHYSKRCGVSAVGGRWTANHFVPGSIPRNGWLQFRFQLQTAHSDPCLTGL